VSPIRKYSRLLLAGGTLLLFSSAAAWSQEADNPKDRAKAARELGKGGADSIPKLAPMLKDSSPDVRFEAVRSIATIGTQHSIAPLIEATGDNDPEIQMRAVDGLVNFYLPGYVPSGIQRLGSAVRARFEKENTQVIDPFVAVRPEVIAAIGKVASGGSSMDSRANAARALGILRGKAAIPDLIQALSTKNDAVIYESLIALQKIGDPSAGSSIAFLLRDLQERVQIAAIETTGILRNREAVPDLVKAYNQARNERVRRAAISALAMVPTPENHALFLRAVGDKDEHVRAAAGEGLARSKNQSDRASLESAFADERKMPPRLAFAFALVALGKTETGEFAPLPYLVNTLNSRAYRGVGEAYLKELARNENIRSVLHGYLARGTKEEKIGIGRVLAVSGDRTSVAYLEKLTKDPDSEVVQESLRAIRNLRARLP
jgi:HEAT repeat protein